MGKRKLYKADLIEMNERRKEGATLRELSKAYGVRKEIVKYQLRLMELHGYAILRESNNRKYPKEIKEQAVKEVLEEKHSIGRTALKYGLPSKSMLSRWIFNYEENDGNLIEKRRGRPRKQIENTAEKGLKKIP